MAGPKFETPQDCKRAIHDCLLGAKTRKMLGTFVGSSNSGGNTIDMKLVNVICNRADAIMGTVKKDGEEYSDEQKIIDITKLMHAFSKYVNNNSISILIPKADKLLNKAWGKKSNKRDKFTKTHLEDIEAIEEELAKDIREILKPFEKIEKNGNPVPPSRTNIPGGNPPG